MTPKRQMREKHLLVGHFHTPNCVFWAILREIISIRLACAGAQDKKTRKEEKSQEVYISRMRGATPGGRISTKHGKCVRLTDLIKRAKFHRYKYERFRSCEVLKFSYCHKEPRPSLTLCLALPQVITLALNILTDRVYLSAWMNVDNDVFRKRRQDFRSFVTQRSQWRLQHDDGMCTVIEIV